MRIKGYKFRSFSIYPPMRREIISVPLKGAKFLAGWDLIRAHMVDNITQPSPLWLMLKEKNLVS